MVVYQSFYMTLIKLNTNSARYDRSMDNYSLVALYERVQMDGRSNLLYQCNLAAAG